MPGDETVHRIEVISKYEDTRAAVKRKKLQNMGFSGITDVALADVYTTDEQLGSDQLHLVATMLTNPVIQTSVVDGALSPPRFDWAIEIGFLQGVTDNVGNTAREGIEDLLKRPCDPQVVHSSQVLYLSGDLSPKDVTTIVDGLTNPLIQRAHIKSFKTFTSEGGMDRITPRVRITDHAHSTARTVDILSMDEAQMREMGKYGIKDHNGPLALNLTYMRTIQQYFRAKGRNPTDVELESIAQTWSEHCKHTIFADPIDELTDGLFKTYIKGATEIIRKKKGDKDTCVSVFKDNSGAVIFDEQHLVTAKVETHNKPSKLDPYGGSITGIVGVKRDAIGFGLGANPVINLYGFCLGYPDDTNTLFLDEDLEVPGLLPRRIMDGVIEGVKDGGNCSGVPTPQGFLVFDKRYRGPPLVIVGTIGVIPSISADRPSHEKMAQPGDYIVMVGGKVGRDGIHGATFSSEELYHGSPATAVQIGDPITQKKMSDALIKEARDLGLYTSITDNGAGGLSCSVAEMARESGGCHVFLNKVPVKYVGLEPWQIWISESQERMTLSVPKEKWETFSELMKKRGVDATIIGEFTDSGKCVVEYDHVSSSVACGNDIERVMDIELDFLHEGLPARPMHTTYTRQTHEEPDIPDLEDLTQSLHAMLGRYNITSYEFVSQQYDHEVQAGSVLKPLQGRGRVNAQATVTRPVLGSKKGVVLSQGINPTYSDIDTYHMAASAIDTAIRTALAAGANLDELYLLDNFCWCSSDKPERLGQLKEAARACFDYAVAYETPFISGKDSMFNDFKGFERDGTAVKISVPPTLTITAMGVVDDVTKTVSLDAKFEGDLVYILGETHDELGASEYFSMIGEQSRGEAYTGNAVPKVDATKNVRLYRALGHCMDDGIIASAQSVARGGLAVALAKTAMGGELGMDVSVEHLPGTTLRDDFALYSESQGRIVVTIAPQDKEQFEQHMQGNGHACIGMMRGDAQFTIKGKSGMMVVNATINTLLD